MHGIINMVGYLNFYEWSWKSFTKVENCVSKPHLKRQEAENFCKGNQIYYKNCVGAGTTVIGNN